jgi:hypothetical protein
MARRPLGDGSPGTKYMRGEKSSAAHDETREMLPYIQEKGKM